MNEDQERKLLAYLDALEGANKQLVIALKECVELLNKYPPPGENPGNWKKMLKSLEEMTTVTNELLKKRQSLPH